MRLSVSFLYYFFNNVGFRLLKFIALIFCARLLSMRDFGIFSLLYSLIAILGALSVFGMHNSVIKFGEESARQGVKNFRHLLRLSFGTNVVLGLALAALILLFRDSVSHYLEVPVLPLLIACATIIPWAAGRTLTFVFRALREPRKSLAVDITGPAIFLLTLAVMAATGTASLNPIMSSNLISLTIALILGFFILRGFSLRLPAPAAGAEKLSLPALLSFSFFAFIATISTLSGSELDRLLLAWFLNPEAVGQYNAAARTAFQLNLFYISFGYAFAPQIVQEHLDQAGSRERDYQRSSLLFWLAAPCFLLAMGLGRYVMLLFGPAYLPALGVFLIITLGGYCNLMMGPSEVYLRMCGFQKVEAANMLVSLVITVSLDLLLIPRLGILGAAVGAATGFVAFKVLSTWFAVRRGFVHLPKKTWVRLLYAVPPLSGAVLTNDPVILSALVLVGLILFFAIEQVPGKDLFYRVKNLLGRQSIPSEV